MCARLALSDTGSNGGFYNAGIPGPSLLVTSPLPAVIFQSSVNSHSLTGHYKIANDDDFYNALIRGPSLGPCHPSPLPNLTARGTLRQLTSVKSYLGDPLV